MILWVKRPKKARKTTTLRIGGRLKFGPSIRGAMWQPPTRSLSPDLVYVRSQGMASWTIPSQNSDNKEITVIIWQFSELGIFAVLTIFCKFYIFG